MKTRAAMPVDTFKRLDPKPEMGSYWPMEKSFFIILENQKVVRKSALTTRVICHKLWNIASQNNTDFGNKIA